MIPLHTHELGMVRQRELLAEAERARLVREALVVTDGPSLAARIAAAIRSMTHPVATAPRPQPVAIRK